MTAHRGQLLRERCEELAQQMDAHADASERLAREYRERAATWRARAQQASS